MADLGMPQSSNLFQDWYDRYVKPKKYSLETSAASPETSLPASPTPTPSAPVVAPPVPGTDAQILESDYNHDAAVANQDQWTGPTPGPTPGASLTDRFNAGLSRVGEGLKDPARMGLLTAGLSMMATPPRQVPYSNAEILGQAGLAGVGMYEKALEAKRRDEMMKMTAEEHTLSREDRRQANLDRAEYYRSTADTRALNASTLEDLRKVNADAKISLDKPIPDSLAKTYNLPVGTTIRDYKQMEPGLIASVKPEKEMKLDPFQEWYRTHVEETGKKPTAKQITDWHRGPGSGGGPDSGPGKVGAIGQVNRELVAVYLPSGRENLTAKGPAGIEELKGMMVMLGNTDQYGGTVNDARLRESLSVDQRKEYDFVKRKAQGYSRTMTPANAVARAQEDWKAKNPIVPAKPPAAAVTPGVSAKKVKMPDGSIQEFDAAGNRVR